MYISKDFFLISSQMDISGVVSFPPDRLISEASALGEH